MTMLTSIYALTQHYLSTPLHHLRRQWPILLTLLFVCLGSVEWYIPSYAGTTPPPVGKIRILKVTDPPGSDDTFTFNLTGPSGNRTKTIMAGTPKTFSDLPVGNGYQISETLSPGWMLKSATCSGNNPIDDITVLENTRIDCTFVNVKNVKLGTIVVKKVTVPADDLTTAFNFTAGGGLSPATFVLKNEESLTFPNLVPGSTYSLTENVASNWLQSNVSCSDGSPATKIDVGAGETVTCTFTNTQRGALVVRKVTTPDPDRTNSTFTFTTDNTLTPNSFALKNGDSVTFPDLEPRLGYRVQELAATNWQLSNSSCSNGTPISNIRIDPGATVTCTFTNVGTVAELTLAKDDGGITAEPGDTIVYVLRYRNDGTKTATGVMLTEQVPNNTTFAGSAANSPLWSCITNAPAATVCQLTIGDLAGGAQGQVTFRVKVDSALPTNVATINNTAKLGYSGVPVAAQSSTSSPVKVAAGLTLSKDDGGVEVNPGGLILYTLRYANQGDQAISGVLITETVPLHTTFVASNQSWSCPVGSPAGTLCVHSIGTVGVGQSGAVTFQVKVADTLPAEVFTIDNQANIGYPILPNADTGTEQTEVHASPDLSLEIDDNDSTVAPGGMVQYRLAYANVGTQAATNVFITANLPAHTTFKAAESTNGWNCNASNCIFTVGSLGSGASSTINLTLTLDRPLPTGSTILATTARIDDDGNNGIDPVPANNEAQDSTVIVDPGEIIATKRDTLVVDKNNDSQASPGDTLEYLITLQNKRGSAVRNVVFTDTLSTSLELVPGLTTSQGVIVEGKNITDKHVIVNIGTIAADSTATIRFRVGIRSPLPAGVLTVANQGSVQSSDFSLRHTDDPDSAAAKDATITPVNANAAVDATLADFLFLDANGDTLVSVGDTLIYRLTVRNRGDRGSEPLQVRVPLADNVILTPNTVTATSGLVRSGNDPEDRVVRVDIGELAGGAEMRVTFQIQIIPMSGLTTVAHQAFIAAQNVTGQAEIPSDDPDTDTAIDATVTTLDQAIVTIQHLYLPVITNMSN